MTNELTTRWNLAMEEMPLIAILRGLLPEQCIEVGNALISAGFRIIEVPLNSPTPFETLTLLNREFGNRAILGAGTVLTANQVDHVIATGCKLIVAPNINQAVADAATKHNAIYCPGVLTPTEAFSAIEHGATALKLFPAEMIPPAIIKALRAVVPHTMPLMPVGGIKPQNMADYLEVGAAGFGVGSALFKPGKSSAEIHKSAKDFVAAFQKAKTSAA